MDDPDARSCSGRDAVRDAGVARDDVEEKLLEGWGVATRALIDDLTLEHVRGTERVRQHRAQDVNVAEFRRQTRAYDVVARRHHLDALAREVGVRFIRRHVHRLSRTQNDVIQHVRTKHTDVSRILFTQTKKQRRDVGVDVVLASTLSAQSRRHRLCARRHSPRVRRHERREHAFKRRFHPLLVSTSILDRPFQRLDGVLVPHGASQLFVRLHASRHRLRSFEPAQRFESLRHAQRHLRFMILVPVLLRIRRV